MLVFWRILDFFLKYLTKIPGTFHILWYGTELISKLFLS